MAALPIGVVHIVKAYELDYSNNTMYFSGHTLGPGGGGWAPPAGVSAVNPIYFANEFPDGTTEPGVFNSSGNVMPNKAGQYAQPDDPSNSGGYGGATGFNALGLTDPGSGMRNDPNRKQKLFNFLQNKNQSGTDWEKMGSAFVAYKMIQRAPANGPWVGASHTVSLSQWQELEDRLVSNSNITMTYDASYFVKDVQNSNGVQYYDTVAGVYRYDVIDNIIREDTPGESDTQAAWVFRDTSAGNAIVLALEVNCANVMGGFAGLPDYDPPVVDLELTKLVDGNDDGIFAKTEQIRPGVPFNYRITLDNVGAVTATGVVAEDPLPAGMTLLGVTASHGAAAPTTGTSPLVTWTLGTVANGASHTLTLRVVVEEVDLPAYRSAMVGGISRNQAEISAMNETDIDSTPGNIATPYVPADREDDEDHADVFMLASLGDYVWLDYNNNGQQDVDEPGLNDVTVELLDEDDAVVATTTTHAHAGNDGYYRFDDLTPGEQYRVRFVTPGGHTSSLTHADGVVGTLDSDADRVTGITAAVVLAPGEHNPTIDAGYVPVPEVPNTGVHLVKTSLTGLLGLAAIVFAAGSVRRLMRAR